MAHDELDGSFSELHALAFPAAPAASEGSPRRSPRGRTGVFRRFEALVDLAPDALVVADGAGRIALVNRQTEVLFGYPREQLLGQPVERLLSERLLAIHQQPRLDVLAAPHHLPLGATLQMLGQRRDGSEFPIEVRLSALDNDDLDDGEVEGADESLVIVSIRDVSDLQRTAAARAAAEAANQKLQQVQALTDTALSHLDLKDLLDALLDRVQTVMGVDNVAILLLEAGGQHLTPSATRGLDELAAVAVAIPVGRGFSGRIAATRMPLVVDDLSTFDTHYAQMRETQQSAMGVPLLVEGRLLGVVYVGSAAPRHFSEAEVQLLQRAADRIALAIDRARAHEAAQVARREAEAALAQARVSEHRFRRLVEAGIIGIVVGDAEHVLDANDAFLQMLDYSREELVAGRLTKHDLMTPAAIAARERAVQEVLATGASQPFEREYVRKDGSRVPALVGMALLERGPTRFVSFVVDLSERKRLEQEREAAREEAERQAEQLDRIFEQMADALALYDTQGQVLRTNTPAQRLLGLHAAPPGFSQLSLPERLAFFAPRDEHGHPLAPEAWPVLRVLRGETQGGVDVTDVHLRTLDGREVDLTSSTAPMRDGEGRIVGAVNILSDITERKRLEQEHVEQAEQLSRIFEGITDGVVVYDAEGRVVRANAAARSILGLDAAPSAYPQFPPAERALLYEAHDEQGRLLAPEDWPLVRVLRGLVTGADARDIRLRTLDGREVDLHTSAAPLRDGTGRLVGAVSILHDQTEQRRLEGEREEALRRSEAWFHSMADTAPVLLWVSDLDGLVTFVNLYWLQFTGRRLEQELGDGWAEAVHPDDYQQCLDTYRTAFHAREPFTMEYRLRRADGAYRWVVDTGVPRYAPNGAFEGYIGSAIDVTEREELKREREEARARELAVREVNQRLDTFVAMAAHDLRHPVSISKLGVELAQRQVLTAATQLHGSTAKQAVPFVEVSRALATTEQSLDRLTRLLQQLLDVARIREGRLVLERRPHLLVDLVRACVEEQHLLAPSRTLVLALRHPDAQQAVVAVDADRLGQVLTNYLSNAVRYSPEDQPIEVTVHVMREGAEDGSGAESAASGVARVEVRDHGPGLPPEEQATIWDRFQRARTASEAGGGLGLGLYIARMLVEQHGGEVGVESVVGQGSTFWFTLPLASTMGAGDGDAGDVATPRHDPAW